MSPTVPISVQYRIYVTPLVSLGVYGSEVEVSDRVTINTPTITTSIDSTDFSIALFTFSDVQLVCDNSDGYFSDSSDSRSIFKYSRDLAKLRIVYDNTNGVSPPQTYQGLINDEGTVIDVQNDSATLLVLGYDSIFRKGQVSSGTVTDGMTAQQAIIAILNNGTVTSVLNLALANINPASNITVDLGAKFDNVVIQKAITDLLGATNSVLVIDSSSNIIVRSRFQNVGNPTIYLYGKGDPTGKENIIALTNYNTGLQRLFNSIVITSGNDPATVPTAVNNNVSTSTYGLRQKTFSFGWLDATNNPANTLSVGNALLTDFKFPKYEFMVTVPTDVVATAQLLDRVSVSYPLLVTPSGKFLPVIGITKVGDTDSPLPYITGAVSIDASLAFKIIEKQEDIQNYVTTLKLRQVGVSSTDGIF